MHAFCLYYPGNVRLVAGVRYFSEQPAFRVFCIDGAIQQSRGNIKVNSATATLIVSCVMDKNGCVQFYLMSSDPKYKDSHNKIIDVDVPGVGNAFVTLLSFLRERYEHTGNTFQLTFSGDKGTVLVETVKDDNNECILSATITGTDGEVMTLDPKIIKQTVASCSAIKSFCYDTVMADCEKSVSVRRGYSEIYREISRYLNKTLCLVSLDKTGTSLVEQYISISSAVEMTTKKDGKRHYRRLQFPFPAGDSPFGAYLVSNSVEDIIREHNNSTRRN